MIIDYFKFAFRSIGERKVRSSLTILGIFLSIMTIFVLLSLSLGLNETVNNQLNELGGDIFFIQPRGQLSATGENAATQLSLSDVKEIEKVTGVRGVSHFTADNGKVEFEEEIRYNLISGVPLDGDKMDLYFRTGIPDPIDGRKFKKNDLGKVVLGNRYAGVMYDKPVMVGDFILVNNQSFEVIGILDAIGSPPDDSLVHMGLEDFKELFNSGDRVDMIIVEVSSVEEINNIAKRVEKKLRNHRNVDEKTQDFSVITPEELLESFGTVLNILTAFLVGIGLVSILVGGIGIANTMYTSVLERNKEIGTMKAVGAKNSDVLKIFVIEAGVLGFIGGGLGLLMGIGIAKIIEYIAFIYLGGDLLKASMNPIIIIGTFLFAFVVGILSGLIPSYQASKLKPVDALRYE